MAVTEEQRHRLYVALERELGEEEANTMMSLVPPVGWADVATKSDLLHLEEKLVLRMDRLAHQLRAELHRETRNVVFAMVAVMAAQTGVLLTVVTLRG
jgi:hypothetical protein